MSNPARTATTCIELWCHTTRIYIDISQHILHVLKGGMPGCLLYDRMYSRYGTLYAYRTWPACGCVVNIILYIPIVLGSFSDV